MKSQLAVESTRRSKDMTSGQGKILEDDASILDLLANSRRVAVLGIKPESHATKPAFLVAKTLQDRGYEIVPVPVYYPDVVEILGEKVYRNLVDIPGDVDIVDVFRRPDDIPAHLPDIIGEKTEGGVVPARHS